MWASLCIELIAATMSSTSLTSSWRLFFDGLNE